uniref:F-box protein 27 n=1 Tax=Canis lupus familiaris TaxID=9615 RepID=A0A8P0P1D2_CANLF
LLDLALPQSPPGRRGPGGGDHGRLGFPGPASPGPRAGARPRGGAGPEPTAARAAPGGAEPRAPAHAAGVLPPGVPGLARPGGRPGPVAAHPGPRPRRPAAARPQLPAPRPRRRALPPGPLLRAPADRTQPHPQPLRPGWGARAGGPAAGSRGGASPRAGAGPPAAGAGPPRSPGPGAEEGAREGSRWPPAGARAASWGLSLLYLTEGLRKWMVQHGGDGWVVEVNRSTVPGAPSQTCFVSSFSWCRKKQVLDLEEEGLWPELLDSGKIEICVSDWWGARHDSGCMYRLLVQLLDANQTVLDKFSAMPVPIQQWNNNVCFQVTHVFSNLKMGVRFVSFEHWGQDTQFWAGHYGARVTNSSVVVRARLS